jgi:putative copper export protein
VLEDFAALVKALLYGAVLSAAGAPLAAASLRVTGMVGDYQARLMRAAAALTIALNVGIAALLFARLGGAFDQPTLGAVFNSGPGAALALQLAGAALLLMPDDASSQAWRISAALLMTASVAFNGHPAAMSPATGLVAMAHVTAAAWWVGSLWLLRRACCAGGHEDIVKLVSRFSSLAVRIIAGLIMAGIVLIVALIDFDRSPWLTDYARVLIVKLAIVALVLGVAIYNKFWLTARLPHETAMLRRSITAELIVIAAILSATAALTTYSSPES